MADERELIAEREKSVAELRARGVNPYANGFVPTHTTAELVAKFAGAKMPESDAPPVKGAPPTLLSDERFRVAGRVAQIRSYVLAPYKMVNDHRTGTKDSDVDGALDGDLDRFMIAQLLALAGDPSAAPLPPAGEDGNEDDI